MPRSPQILALAEQLARLEQASRRQRRQRTTAAGDEDPLAPRLTVDWLVPLWPPAGVERGMLVEWLGDAGSGAGSLALATACAALQQTPGPLAVVDGPRPGFYAPAAAAAGLDLARTLLICPADAHDRAWVLEQVLRSSGLAATLCWLPEFRTATAAGRALRRWQLAAESHGGVGLFVRPLAARDEPSFSTWRLLTTPVAAEARSTGRRVRVEVISGPGLAPGRSILLELDDETGDVHLVSKLAGGTRADRRA